MHPPTPHLASCFLQVMTKNSSFPVSAISDIHPFILPLISSVGALWKMQNVSFPKDLLSHLLQPTRRRLLKSVRVKLIFKTQDEGHKLNYFKMGEKDKDNQSLHLKSTKEARKIGGPPPFLFKWKRQWMSAQISSPLNPQKSADCSSRAEKHQSWPFWC